jgi:hypothetical protein
MYKHGHPPGGMFLEIRDTNGKLIGTSNTVTVAAIDAQLVTDGFSPPNNDFHHGYVKFDIDTPLKSGTDYIFALMANGSYVFNETAGGSTGYMGWARDYDHRKYEADYDAPTIGTSSAMNIEFWGRKVVERG